MLISPHEDITLRAAGWSVSLLQPVLGSAQAPGASGATDGGECLTVLSLFSFLAAVEERRHSEMSPQ